MNSRFNPNAPYLADATPAERIQLQAMAKIIEAKVAELIALRAERATLAHRIYARQAARERREESVSRAARWG